MPPKKKPPPKKPFIIVVKSSIGYDTPSGGRTKSLNVLKKLYDALGVEVIVMDRLRFDDEMRRGFKEENRTKNKLLASGRQEYKNGSVPSASKTDDTDKKKPRKVKITTLKKKLTSGELRKLISNHNKLTKIKIPKGTDYAGLEKIISDAGFTIDHENKKLISTGKSKEIPLPKPETMEEKEEKKKVAVERKRQKAIKDLTDKNVKKQEKKNLIKGAVALKNLVSERQRGKKLNKENEKDILKNRKRNEKPIKLFLKRWKDDNFRFKTEKGESKAIEDSNYFSPPTFEKFMDGLQNVFILSMTFKPNYKKNINIANTRKIVSYSYEIEYEFQGKTSRRSYAVVDDKIIADNLKSKSKK